MSLFSFNINGSLVKKLEDECFVNLLSRYDIIVLTECWTNANSFISLDGYECISKHRIRRKKGKRDSGGITCFFAKAIWKGVENVEWNFEDGLIFKLNKDFFGWADNIFTVFTYMKPAKSQRNVLDAGTDEYERLYDKIAELSEEGEIILMGDMNARCATLNDCIDIEDAVDVLNVPISARKIYANDLLQCGMSVQRSNEDKHVNEYGHRLIDLCTSGDLICLNGRCGQDKDIGKFTFANKLGKSAIDFTLCSKGILNTVLDFNVGSLNVFSDHAPISLSISCSVNEVVPAENVNTTRKGVRWREKHMDDYVGNINSEKCKNDLKFANELLDSELISQECIDECVSKISNVMLEAGEKHISYSSNRPQTNNQRWYDDECRALRDEFVHAEKIFRHSGNEPDRISMCTIRSKYRNCCRTKRRKFKIREAEELLTLSRLNPRSFWKKVRKKSSPSVGNCDFFGHFKNLANSEPLLGEWEEELVSDWESSDAFIYNPVLDDAISLCELENAIKKMKSGKSPGIDSILNEFIKYGGNDLKSTILKAFNVILNTGLFPEIWATGEIIPLHKKGDKNDPLNYRGITLLSCLGKLFTNVINNRLNIWAEANGTFCDEQFGFRKNRGTRDCMFILQGLIDLTLSKGKPLYCAFVDLQRAFDSANRRAIWYKLNLYSISSKVISLIRNMYDKIKVCVKSMNKSNDENNDTCFFKSKVGVFQGESLSPFLFSMYLNDLSNELSSCNELGVNVYDWLVTILLFADDMVLFSESRKGLQNGLNELAKYCEKWGLTVNVPKTKCVAFKRGGKLSADDKWYYNNEAIETVNHFKYLGFVFGSSGKHSKGVDELELQAKRALFGLKSILQRHPEMAPKTQLQLFDSLVKPILDYSCEIWGFLDANKLETIHLGFLKAVLGVRKTVPTPFVYTELNRMPLVITRKCSLVKYWLNILSLDFNNPVRKMYTALLRASNENDGFAFWTTHIKSILSSNGFANVWNTQGTMNNTHFFKLFKQRLNDTFTQSCSDLVSQTSPNRLYRLLSPRISGTEYLCNVKEKFLRMALAKMRLGSHNLMVERGRWNKPRKIPFHDRLCQLCHTIEDEYHIIIECPRFLVQRKKYIPNNVTTRPSMFKLINFLDNVKDNQLRKFSFFCYIVFNIYDSNL